MPEQNQQPEQPAPDAPATLNLDQLRELVRVHALVEQLEACLKRAKAEEALLEQLEECSEHAASITLVEGAAEGAATQADDLRRRLAALRVAFEFKTRTDVRVTRAGNKESRSSRNARTLRKL